MALTAAVGTLESTPRHDSIFSQNMLSFDALTVPPDGRTTVGDYPCYYLRSDPDNLEKQDLSRPAPILVSVFKAVSKSASDTVILFRLSTWFSYMSSK